MPQPSAMRPCPQFSDSAEDSGVEPVSQTALATCRSAVRLRRRRRAVDVVSDELARFVESMLVAPLEITSVEGQQILWF
jgi:hypothetical protein